MTNHRTILITVIITSISLVGIVGYYLLIYIPERDARRETQLFLQGLQQSQQTEDSAATSEREAVELDTTAFDGCLKQRSGELWDEAGGITEKCIATENCIYNLNVIYNQKAKDYCIQKYPRADLTQFPILYEDLK